MAANPDADPMALLVRLLSAATVMQAINRYPLDDETLLTTVVLVIERRLDDGQYDANSFAVRRLLIDYTTEHVDKGLVEKGKLDRRTNVYTLTRRGPVRSKHDASGKISISRTGRPSRHIRPL